jgi:hypothetical protein
MNLAIGYGVGLILLTIVMVWIGRPPKGEDSATFLRVWIVGQFYALLAMVSAIAGVTLIINGWQP